VEQSKTGSEVRRVIRKYLPWVVTILIFIYLFKRIPVDEVIEAGLKADFLPYLAISVFGILFGFFWDGVVYSFIFNRFGTPVTFRGMLPVRGAIYLLMVLNYNVGQGGFALIMNRWKKMSISRAASVVIYTMFVDYYVLLTLCLAGAFLLPGVDLAKFFDRSKEGDLVRFVVISWAVFMAHIWFYRRFLPRTERFQWVKNTEVLSAFREAPTVRYFQIIFLRVIGSAVGIILTYFALITFGLRVPILELTVMLPIVWLIGSIPITVMGLGTSQAAMIWLIARVAQGAGGPAEIDATVLAFSLLGSILHHIGLFIIGAVCISQIPRSIWAPKPGESTAD